MNNIYTFKASKTGVERMDTIVSETACEKGEALRRGKANSSNGDKIAHRQSVISRTVFYYLY